MLLKRKQKKYTDGVNVFTGNHFLIDEQPCAEKIQANWINRLDAEIDEVREMQYFSMAEQVIGTDGMIEYHVLSDVAVQRFYQFADFEAYATFKEKVYPVATKFADVALKQKLDKRMKDEFIRLYCEKAQKKAQDKVSVVLQSMVNTKGM